MSDNPPHSPAPRTAKHDVALSVFFPCYNEEGNVERVVTRAVEVLDGLVREWDIIVVDDGSRDRTGEIADRLAAADPRVGVVHHRTNGGYGMALRSGFAAATKEYVFYTDGDGQFDIAELDGFLAQRHTADILSGVRVKRQDPLMRRVNAACWSWLVRHVLRFRCKDVDSAFKLYRREMFGRMELQSTGALIDAEILARATRLGYTIRDLPVSHLPRIAGTQSGANLRVILRAFKELLRLRKQILQTQAQSR